MKSVFEINIGSRVQKVPGVREVMHYNAFTTKVSDGSTWLPLKLEMALPSCSSLKLGDRPFTSLYLPVNGYRLLTRKRSALG